MNARYRLHSAKSRKIAKQAGRNGQHQDGRQTPLSDNAAWATVRQTNWIVALTLVSAISSIVATAFAGIQAFDPSGSEQAKAATAIAKAASESVEVSSRQSEVAKGMLEAAKSQTDASRHLAAAAQDSATTQKTSLELERAVGRPQLLATKLAITGLDTYRKPGDPLPRLTYTFRNTGRATLTLKEASIQYAMGRSLNEVPRYYPGDLTRHFISPEGIYYSIKDRAKISMTTETAESIRLGESKIWIYGFFTYDDALGTNYKSCFLYHIEVDQAGNSGEFIPINSPKYAC